MREVVPLRLWSAAGCGTGCFPADELSSLLSHSVPCGVSLARLTAGVNPFHSPPKPNGDERNRSDRIVFCIGLFKSCMHQSDLNTYMQGGFSILITYSLNKELDDLSHGSVNLHISKGVRETANSRGRKGR